MMEEWTERERAYLSRAFRHRGGEGVDWACSAGHDSGKGVCKNLKQGHEGAWR